MLKMDRSHCEHLLNTHAKPQQYVIRESTKVKKALGISYNRKRVHITASRWKSQSLFIIAVTYNKFKIFFQTASPRARPSNQVVVEVFSLSLNIIRQMQSLQRSFSRVSWALLVLLLNAVIVVLKACWWWYGAIGWMSVRFVCVGVWSCPSHSNRVNGRQQVLHRSIFIWVRCPSHRLLLSLGSVLHERRPRSPVGITVYS